MGENTVKIRLKVGQMKVEYEGRESFLKDELSNCLEMMTSLYDENRTTQPFESLTTCKEESDSTHRARKFNLSTTTIAARMKVKNAPELALAACVFLTLVEDKEECSRSEILNEMKKAKNYYNSNMPSNLTKNLKSLVKSNHLNEIASGNYALTADKKEEMDRLLA